jgi:hypothetical protein
MKLTHWARYLLERWMSRGSPAMLVLLVLILASVATGGALMAHALPGNHFASFGEAFWWAILRISDTGYLSDDIADIKIRALSVMLSVIGMLVTVGGIVAIVVQSLNRILANLAAATTPVPFSGHVVLLGWTDRTPRLLEVLLTAQREKIVVLIEEVGPAEIRRLARTLPSKSDHERVVLRRGNALRKVDLARAACADSKVVILAATAAASANDAAAGPRALKALLALRTVFSKSKGPAPLVVVEVVDRSLVQLAEATLPDVRVLHSDQLISRALRIGLQASGMLREAPRMVRPHPDWSFSLTDVKQTVGASLQSLESVLDTKILVGVTRNEGHGPRLLIHGETGIKQDDQVVRLSTPRFFALKHQPVDQQQLDDLLITRPLRILILGWNEVVPDLIAELGLEPKGRYVVDVVGPSAPKKRKVALSSVPHVKRLELNQIQGNPSELQSVVGLDLSSYDRFVVVSDRTGSADTSDARSLAVVLELDRQRAAFRPGAYVTVELLEPEDLEILQGVDTVVTPQIIADVLASLALTSDSHESLQNILMLQATFVSRVIDLPSGCAWDELELRQSLRRRSLALLQILAGPSGSTRILFAEPVAVDSSPVTDPAALPN